MTVITIDGPSGSGKGTVVMVLSQKLGFDFLDSGALYRLVALQAMQQKVAFDDASALATIADTLPVTFLAGKPESGAKALLDGIDVSAEIRTEKVAGVASKVACLPEVRTALLARQRAFETAAKQRNKGLIADGRDMGTVVFPQAKLKIFLTASAEVRAQRRLAQLRAKGDSVNIDTVLRDIETRDARDKCRKTAPLRAAEDAMILDTSHLSALEVVQAVEAMMDSHGFDR